MSSLAAYMTAEAAPYKPLTARTHGEDLPRFPAPSMAPGIAAAHAVWSSRRTLHSPCKAARASKLCMIQDSTFIVKPCCQEENSFWGNERITTELLICHDPILHWGDCWLQLGYCALCGIDVIRTTRL